MVAASGITVAITDCHFDFKLTINDGFTQSEAVIIGYSEASLQMKPSILGIHF